MTGFPAWLLIFVFGLVLVTPILILDKDPPTLLTLSHEKERLFLLWLKHWLFALRILIIEVLLSFVGV